MEIRSGSESPSWGTGWEETPPKYTKNQAEKARGPAARYPQAPGAVFGCRYRLRDVPLPGSRTGDGDGFGSGPGTAPASSALRVPKPPPSHAHLLHLPKLILCPPPAPVPGLLVPLLQAAEAVGPLGRKAAAVGSSVLLPGPGNVTHVYATRWEFLDGASSRAILQYQGGSHHPAIHAPYTGRAVFHPSNGSLLLEDLRESDSGVYKVTVTPGGGESLEILLEVLSKRWEWEGGAGQWVPAGRWCSLTLWTIGPAEGLGKGFELSLGGPTGRLTRPCTETSLGRLWGEVPNLS